MSVTMGSLRNDVAVPGDGEDTISRLAWSPVANHLAAASWDGKARIYDVNASGSAKGVTALTTDSPLFDCTWAKDGTTIIAAGASKKNHYLHLPSGQQGAFGSHDAPIRGVRVIDVPSSNEPIVVSGSWDKTVKYWDPRRPDTSPICSLACNDRVYAMDAKAGLLVIATAERHIHLVDLREPTKFLSVVLSPLAHQTKHVTVFPDGKGWATASIEGRCGINAVAKNAQDNVNFSFRCHRDPMDTKKQIKVWAVNDFQFHPTRTTCFVTAGSDGVFSFWDRVKRAHYPRVSGAGMDPAAITSVAFNADGSFLAYAIGYDWSRGCAGNAPSVETKIMLHAVTTRDSVHPR
ncbi:WD40 repeat-like protein [Xylariaceae sp. FL1272]|nr:WD40 repeat-like protein [Xylariaceae sp. FL1272]